MHSRRKVIPFRTDEDETEHAIFLLMERKNDRRNGPARRKISILQYVTLLLAGGITTSR